MGLKVKVSRIKPSSMADGYCEVDAANSFMPFSGDGEMEHESLSYCPYVSKDFAILFLRKLREDMPNISNETILNYCGNDWWVEKLDEAALESGLAWIVDYARGLPWYIYDVFTYNFTQYCLKMEAIEQR